ncbi:hypothetical protein BCR35DRAFT_103466 [Leucosporidium creatinivorum]|uniref:SPX domain-containing protein n=1 Tax=Leucosporidium creatinivorum TaxID=106004 RepID=A0A1Y2F3R8_9BASI|nr:hypothetical protein BCR35DRAFT_103466 [Leucosporidium creatinivorum]
MKFGKTLASQASLHPGWSSEFCDYKGLKKIINSLAKGRPADAALLAAGIRPPRPPGPEEPLHPSTEPQLIAHTASAGHNGAGPGKLLQAHKAAFFFKLERELEKINAFYYQRESALKVRLRTLIDKRKLLTASLSDASGKVKALSRDSSSYGALYEGFRNFERDLGRLQTYIELNATAFRKICKKWDKACRRQADRFGDQRPQQGEHDGQLYLARQVEVQPVFNREFIAELSDVASANLLSLENLVGNEGKRRGPEALADGTGIETNGAPGGTIWTMDIERADSAEALEDLEHALVVAVKSNDRTATKEILKILLPESQTEIRAPVSRILWRAVLEEEEPKKAEGNGDATAVNGEAAAPTESAIPTSLLDFTFVDDINGRTSLHEVRHRRRILMRELPADRFASSIGRQRWTSLSRCSMPREGCRCLPSRRLRSSPSPLRRHQRSLGRLSPPRFRLGRCHHPRPRRIQRHHLRHHQWS